MSYFDFFCKNYTNKNEEAIVGTCLEMCPQEEVEMREKEKMIHMLEIWGPIVKKPVKSYSRSAADCNMTSCDLLRPYSVLKETMQYLLLDVAKRSDVSTACVYDFINDRLRAVRQDITIQRLPSEECATLLEPMIRFYVLYGYKLCEAPIKDFDPVLNKKYLLECMKWYLTCVKDDIIDEVSGMFSQLDLSYKLKCDRVLVECLYLLCNMDDLSPLFRYLTLPKHIKSKPKVKLSYRIAIANLRGNYIQVCRLMGRLCPLTYCALCIYLPTLQRRALLVMSHAYSSKTVTVPLGTVRDWLRFNSAAEAIAACAHYGLRPAGAAVSLTRGEFKHDVAILQPAKQYQLEKKLDFKVDNIFTYISQ